MTDKKRLFFIDNLRVATIMLVVLVHLAVTYSSLGIWYYNEDHRVDVFSHYFFWLFQLFVQSFTMGMLFFVSGYFTSGSLRKKGFLQYIKERFHRLIIPTVIFFTVVTPLTIWFEARKVFAKDVTSFGQFIVKYFGSWGFELNGVGPMWFALALFAFCLVYALINKINSNLFDLEIFKEQKLYNLIHFFLIILIAVVAFIIRLYLPIGTIVWGMQYCYFSSYIFLFFAGVIAGRTGYIENISSKELRNWLYAGIGVYLAGWLIMVLSSPLYDPSASSAGMSKSLMAFHGGMNFKSAFFALVESFVAVSMTLGLLGFFKDKINFTNSITKKLSDGAFGVYMFHPPIIIAVTLYLQPLMFMPFIKWIIAGMISIPLCFAIAYYVLLKIPVLNKIL